MLPQSKHFAVWPDTWYVVARSSDISRDSIFDGAIANRPFVIFRTGENQLIALNAHCPHMGAHLRRAKVVGETLHCPLHHLIVDCNGHLKGQDACRERQSRAWPVVEQFGLVFLFAGKGVPPPLPFSDTLNEYVWTSGKPLLLKADWRAMIVNGFDIRHMSTVHQRELTGPPDFTQRDGAIVFKYATRVTSTGGFSNWVTRRLSQNGGIRIQQTCIGTIMLVESALGSIRSTAIFGLLKEGNKVRAFNSFGTLMHGNFWRTRLYITRWLYYFFLRKDFSVIEDMQLNVDGIEDPGVLAISDYLRALPALDDNNSP